MLQVPDQAAVERVLQRVQQVYGQRIAAEVQSSMTDAWGAAADRGVNAGAFASALLLARAVGARRLGRPGIAHAFDRLAEESARAWLAEVDVRSMVTPDDIHELIPDEIPAARPDNPEEEEQMTTDFDEHPQTVKRRAALEADSLQTYEASGGDMWLWPSEFAKPQYTKLGRNDWHIEIPLRPYYRRDAREDGELLDSLPDDFATLSTDCDPNGPPIQLSKRRDKVMVLHALAMRRARFAKKQADDLAAEQYRDQTQRTCGACGVVDDQVKPRSVGGWRHRLGSDGPRLCRACYAVAEQVVAEHRTRRSAELGAEQVSDGRARADAVGDWLAANYQRTMGS